MGSAAKIRKYWLDVLRTIFYLQHVWNKMAKRSTGFSEAARGAFYDDIWEKAARELSLSLVRLPDGFLEVRAAAAVTRLYQSFVMLDHPATVHLAGNKPLVHKLLAEHGLPVPEHCVFTLSDLRSAEAFLSAQKGPCVVKPAKGTGGGEAVTTNIINSRQLQRAAIRASLFSNSLMIERQVEGESYRLLYLDGELLDAIRRGSPTVTGDGRSKIRTLIEEENKRRVRMHGDISLARLGIDLDCMTTLETSGLSLDSIPPPGRKVVIKKASNENSNRENESVREGICADVVRDGAKAASVLGLQLAGVDVLATDITVPLAESGGVINEVNATPGLHFHYQVTNPQQGVPVAVPILRRLLCLNGGKQPLSSKRK